MRKSEVIEHFGGESKTASVLGISHPAVCRWGEVIPQKQAFVIERITKGKLKYDASLYQKAVSVQREPSGHNLKHPTKWCPPNK